jgi:hypothetical protein
VHVEPVGEPHGEQLDARVGLLARHLDGDDLAADLVEGGGQHRAPRGDPGPGQVGVARLVALGPGPQLVDGLLGRVAVGDPALARAPSGSFAGSRGASTDHQTTTGASGSSSGRTTDWAWSETSPYSRRTTVSPVPASAPTRTSASSRDFVRSRGERETRLITTSVREGCSREASLAAFRASYAFSSSVTMTRVRTMPTAGVPMARRPAPAPC